MYNKKIFYDEMCIKKAKKVFKIIICYSEVLMLYLAESCYNQKDLKLVDR